jgi:hypothetical protein
MHPSITPSLVNALNAKGTVDPSHAMGAEKKTFKLNVRSPTVTLTMVNPVRATCTSRRFRRTRRLDGVMVVGRDMRILSDDKVNG